MFNILYHPKRCKTSHSLKLSELFYLSTPNSLLPTPFSLSYR
ncbi:hypothetical protein [Moorena sp. SIO3I8]|nr:hypothetical protein [Moorena sp. SIO3I8]